MCTGSCDYAAPLCAEITFRKMKKFLLFLGTALCVTLSANEASAQIKVGEGQVSVALESNSIYYLEDKQLVELNSDNAVKRDIGSHDYLKVDYNLNKFSAGVQLDGFLPAINGYDIAKYQQRDTYNTYFLSVYAQYEADNWGVRVGDIYDQFGNGLIFRSYEERALGFNNSLFGARASYNLNNMVNVKVLAGKPRLYDSRSETLVWGGDLSLSVSDMIGWYNGIIGIEGSYVGRKLNDFETMTHPMHGGTLEDEILNMVSGRANFEYAGFTLRGEYAKKLNNDFSSIDRNPSDGNVINIDMGYNYKRFSISGTFRRQENMVAPIDIRLGEFSFEALGGGNVINYIPLLTRQHTYMLAGLNPYRGCTVFTGGEIGGQVDVYYSLRNPKARGKYWNFHANFSMFNTLDHGWMYDSNRIIEGRNAWLDINFDVDRQWSKKLKTTFLYSFQKWDESLNHSDALEDGAHYCASHIFVGDVTYKFNKKHSMRVELQYLSSDDYEGDWVAGLIEYNLAPKFSFYVSDMWNFEETDLNYSASTEKHYLMHYYQVGATYTHSSYRVQLAYGRNRAGYVCSGGACRYQPAYTGFNLAFTMSF